MTNDFLKGPVRAIFGVAGVQVTNRVLALFLGVVLARTMGPDGYGVYALSFSILSVLLVAAEGGAPTLLLREVAAARGAGAWPILAGVVRLGLRYVALLSIAIVSLGVIVLVLFDHLIELETYRTFFIMLFLVPFAALTKSIGHVLRGLNKLIIAQVLELLLRPLLALGLIVFVFLLYPEASVPYNAMVAQLAAAIAVLIVAVCLLRWAMPKAAGGSEIKFLPRQWLRSALPFTLIGGALIINSQTDVIMLGWLSTTEEVGVYRVAAQGAMLVLFPLQIFQVILAPKFASYYGKNEYALLRSLDRRSRGIIILTTFPIFFVLVVFSNQVVRIPFGDAFIGAVFPLTILASGFFLNASCGASGLLMQMSGHERQTAIVLWSTSLMNILGNIFLIPLFGSIGAAISTGITIFVYQLILRYKSNKLLGGHYDRG